MNDSLSLLNDLYQLTMAYGYWKNGVHEQQACFHLSFRRLPFEGGFAIACGQGTAQAWLEQFRFDETDIAYLATLTGADDKPLFESGFLKYLQDLRLEVEISAVREGEIVFGHEPILRVCGPVLHCQLVETALLTIINFQTLIATKAARVKWAARGERVLEFGARRAQGIDGALSASRAAYIGGADATSNVLAGKTFGVPVRGTHAHSWVMLWQDEKAAFEAYAQAMPNNCTFLVDTYNTLDGVRHAIEVGRELRRRGYELNGIRLDSGDLAYLSIEARQLLDEAGFLETDIVASNDLDEQLIENLKLQGAKINVWGVGTRLVTGGEQSALGGVYKLSSVRDEDGIWQPRVKLSEQTVKTSLPGRLQVRRWTRDGYFVADAIYDVETAADDFVAIVHPSDPNRRYVVPENATHRDLLQPWWRADGVVEPLSAYDLVNAARERAQTGLGGLHPTIRRLVNAHEYPAGLESSLHERRVKMIAQARSSHTSFS